jgi:ubiquinone/menaquinone biosynthesis C-methylase UbiE
MYVGIVLVPPPVRAWSRRNPLSFTSSGGAQVRRRGIGDHRRVSGHPIVAAVYDRMLAGSERAGLAQRRAHLLLGARGRVLEIGAGTGANLAAYPEGVGSLTLVEPDPHMARRLRARLAADPPAFEHELLEIGAERLPFEDGHFDTAVATLVLCTIPDPGRALAEVARVLAPAGSMLVIEHVRDLESARRARWQDRLERPWGWLAGGCHPNRDTRETLRRAGFDVSGLEPAAFPKGGPIVKPMIQGRAARSSSDS